MPITDPNVVQTLMGWNQVVYISSGSDPFTGNILRVTDYEIGSRQTGDAPDYITGKQDRTAWTKGPVEIEGTLNYPLTFETGTGTENGFTMFQRGANLANDIQQTFSIGSTSGEVIGGCKVQTTSISCNSGEPIQCSSTVWGISADDTNTSSTETRTLFTTTTETVTVGTPTGVDVDGKFTTAQVPMWDIVKITGAPPGMLITGFSVQIENQLQRNYTMGNEEASSPFGLNATSISAGQRRVTGTITWQSNASGTIDAVMGAGIAALTIEVGAAFTMTMTKCLWNAQPPRLSTGDRVTVESGFTALGLGVADFDAFTLTI